ncbi:MAG: phosphoserine phosphatase SerB [Actinomycetota bacterium]
MKYRLVLFDVDSTLIQQEVIDLLAAKTEHGQIVSDITRRAMVGEIDFDTALTKRVALLKDLPETVLCEVLDEISFSPGALTLLARLRERSFLIGAVSGGFSNVLEPLFNNLKLDFLRANRLEIRDSHLTGKVLGPIINREMKRSALIEFAGAHGVELEETIAVGDGANDLLMIQTAGLGVSYRGKAILNEAADLVLSQPELDALLEHI